MYPLTETTDHEKVTNDFFRQRTKKKKKIIRLEQAKITISVPIRAGLNGLTLRPPRSHYRCCPGKKRKKKRGKSTTALYRFIVSTEMEEMAVPDFESEVRYIVVETRFTLNYASFILSLSL